ncbi:DNA topoisomerase IV subunit A [bacterium]|nr:DNA topoisomerase IV subunit A [bacterium]
MSDDAATDERPPGGVIDEPMSSALSKRYLAYALSTITSRALPDVRDGMKPVHRRLLYAMRELNLDPDGAYKKCARVVGDVIGKYHPHGDQSIYDALVRLAQDFNVRYPLIDGQGNFGNIDGDNAAAFRYTESRLTPAAMLLLDGLDEDAVDFRDTYDGENSEPVVLPAGFPNLLANGSSGIAVGMATSIPPHNAAEAIDAAILLLDQPEAGIDDLMKIVPGPDFPTGGVIVESTETIREAYVTGRGSIRLQARWEKEEVGRGVWRIVVTEIPYQVQKSKLIERLAELLEQKKLPLVEDVRDESTEDIRIVIEPKSRTVDPDMLMGSVFRQSDFETRFSVNMNVIDRNVPKVMGLKDMLRAFLDHRREVVVRRGRHRLEKIERRLEVLDGFLIAYLNIDEVIRIIRFEDDPKAELMKAFGLSEVQTDAILNMRLRSLRKLEEIEIKGEHAKLAAERETLVTMLMSPKKQWLEVRGQLARAREVFDPSTSLGRRRSDFGAGVEVDSDAVLDAMVAREPVTVVLSTMGWIRALKGHGQDLDKVRFKEGDELAFALECQTTDKVVLMSSGGRAFTFGADKLPGGRGAGEPIRLSVDLPEDEAIIAMLTPVEGAKRLLASTAGNGFLVPEAELVTQTRKGKVIMTPGAGDQLLVCTPAAGDHVAVIGDNRKLLIFPAAELPEMARGKGVRLQGFKDGGLADAIVFAEADGFAWADPARRRIGLPEWREWIGRRASSGRMAPKGFNRNGRFSG